jgi:hypothetical protein
MSQAIGQLQSVACARPAHAHGVAALVFVKGDGADRNQRTIKAAIRSLHSCKNKNVLCETSSVEQRKVEMKCLGSLQKYL